MISSFNNKAQASCYFEKTRNKSDDSRFYYYCITVSMASIKIVSFQNLYQIQSLVIKWSLKSRGLDKTWVIYVLISLKAIWLYEQTIKLRNYLTLYQTGRWKQIQIHRVLFADTVTTTKRIYQWNPRSQLAEN